MKNIEGFSDLQRAALGVIERRSDRIIEIGEDIFRHPELGYKEFRTAAVTEENLRGLGLAVRAGLAKTGVKARLEGCSPGPNICIISELDAVVSPAHPAADPETGAAHACGHNAQVAGMLGAAFALAESGVMERLSGSVTFFAVPAEEFAELEFRSELVRRGEIEFLGGKQELIRLGEFDDIDLAMMIHAKSGDPGPNISAGRDSLGFTAKMVRLRGKAAHGSAPEHGVNALNAAMAALMNIHINRETFRDEDHIRVHPIITRGGDLVNIVPDDVSMEMYVRGSAAEAISDACAKVDRSIRAGAMAVGAEAEITDIAGYLPLVQNPELFAVFSRNAELLLGGCNEGAPFSLGSTDAGDLSHIMPVIHPCVGGFTGGAHARDYAIADRDAAYILPARLLALTAIDLLCDGAENAREILRGFEPALTKERYLAMLRG